MEGVSQSKYIARWRHREKLVFRCWPKWKLTHEAILREKEIPITGMKINGDGHAELWHQISGTRSYVFEISDEDFDTITAIPTSGAKMLGKMIVHCPGTADQRVKKECWLEIEVEVYSKAFRRIITPWGPRWKKDSPFGIRGETIEDALGLAGMMGSKYIFIERDEDVDEDVILKEIIENDAIIVLNRLKWGNNTGVSSRVGRDLMKKALYWTIPGRQPWEEGGLYRGYQIADRFVRWTRTVAPENRERDQKERLDRMHEKTREKGVSSRRKYFLENTVTRFAERVGMSRQRVMSKFLDDGVVDWLMRSVDNIKAAPYRETPALLRARVSDAVRALEFYYRAIEGLREEKRGVDI